MAGAGQQTTSERKIIIYQARAAAAAEAGVGAGRSLCHCHALLESGSTYNQIHTPKHTHAPTNTRVHLHQLESQPSGSLLLL